MDHKKQFMAAAGNMQNKSTSNNTEGMNAANNSMRAVNYLDLLYELANATRERYETHQAVATAARKDGEREWPPEVHNQLQPQIERATGITQIRFGKRHGSGQETEEGDCDIDCKPWHNVCWSSV